MSRDATEELPTVPPLYVSLSAPVFVAIVVLLAAIDVVSVAVVAVAVLIAFRFVLIAPDDPVFVTIVVVFVAVVPVLVALVEDVCPTDNPAIAVLAVLLFNESISDLALFVPVPAITPMSDPKPTFAKLANQEAAVPV
jgi:hypothetical protein